MALERFQVLQPYLENQVTLRQIAQNTAIPYRTLQHWMAAYQQSGLTGLARKTRSDHGGRRGLSTELQHCIEGLALQRPPLSIAVIHRQVSQLAKNRQEKIPGYHQVYNIVKQVPDGLSVLARQGSKAYSDQFDLVYRREAEAPNAIWQADHTLLDILVQQENGEPGRPWLSIVIDDYSRSIAGYYLTWDAPSAIQTALALRQAIWRKMEPHWTICGIPNILYVDNGSDFTSHHLEQGPVSTKLS